MLAQPSGPQFIHQWRLRRSRLYFAATWFRSPRQVYEQERTAVSNMLYDRDPRLVLLASLMSARPRMATAVLCFVTFSALLQDLVKALIPTPVWLTEDDGCPLYKVRIRGLRWLRLAFLWTKPERVAVSPSP